MAPVVFADRADARNSAASATSSAFAKFTGTDYELQPILITARNCKTLVVAAHCARETAVASGEALASAPTLQRIQFWTSLKSTALIVTVPPPLIVLV